jgi:hypothetical protein
VFHQTVTARYERLIAAILALFILFGGVTIEIHTIKDSRNCRFVGNLSIQMIKLKK